MNYSLSIARTNEVRTAGKKTQNQADQRKRKPMQMAVEIKNAIQ